MTQASPNGFAQKLRLYLVDGKKIVVASVDFSLFVEETKMKASVEYIGEIDGFYQHQQHTVVEGEAKVIPEEVPA